MPLARPIIVLGIHGLGGHSGWFANLKEQLEDQDVDFFAYDLPGFGQNHIMGNMKSEHLKGHVNSYKEWVDFVTTKYEDLKSSYPAARVVILGHSLGAVIASCLEKIYKGDLLVLSVPGYKGAAATFNPRFTISTMRRILIDKFVLGNDVFVEMPVSEKAKETPALTDPLRVSSVTQTLLFEVLKMGEKAKKQVLEKTCPIFMIQIENDAVVDNATQDRIYDKLSATHKMKRTYIGADHDWIWDYGVCHLVTQDLVEWFERV